MTPMDEVNTGLFQSMALVVQKRAILIMNFLVYRVIGVFPNKRCKKSMRMA